MFVTYRDPNLSESYKVYDEAADYVVDFDADDRDMKKYIIGRSEAWICQWKLLIWGQEVFMHIS